MATKKEIDEHLQIALKEIGEILPWYEDDVSAWVFSHKKYPVEYAGNSKKEVIKNYPKYLRVFIEHRLDNNLNPLTEKKTKGKGGKRVGAGRPKGTKGPEKQRVYVPIKIVSLLNNKIDLVEELGDFLKIHPEIDSPKQIQSILYHGIDSASHSKRCKRI